MRFDAQELVDACRHLGDIDLRMLGYHDSGMDGTPENDAAHAFVNASFDEVVEKVVDVFREISPQVVVTYNEYGGVRTPRPHPGAPSSGARRRSVCDVPKMYYTAFPKSLMRAGPRDVRRATSSATTRSNASGRTTPIITTMIDVVAYVDRKFAALAGAPHAARDDEPFLDDPRRAAALALGAEHYVLARSPTVERRATETDLFAGL